MFPKKDFNSINDLRKVTMEILLKLYSNYARIKIKNQDLIANMNGTMTEREKQDKMRNDKKINTPPTDVFQKILDLFSLPFHNCTIKLFSTLKIIAPVQDSTSPSDLNNLILNEFTRKYGKTFISRGSKFSKNLIEKLWNNYSNCDSLYFDRIVTRSQIMRAISLAPDSVANNITLVLQNMTSRNDKNYAKNSLLAGTLEGKERAWDRERVERCATVLREASDHMKSYLIVTYYHTLPSALPLPLPISNSTSSSMKIGHHSTLPPALPLSQPLLLKNGETDPFSLEHSMALQLYVPTCTDMVVNNGEGVGISSCTLVQDLLITADMQANDFRR